MRHFATRTIENPIHNHRYTNSTITDSIKKGRTFLIASLPAVAYGSYPLKQDMKR